MSQIPEDVMKLARQATQSFLGMAPCYPEQFQLQDAFACAILSDRSSRSIAETGESEPTPQTLLSGIEDEIARVVQSVNEWDDRTSPDEYPEHLLITSEELADILRNFAASIATEGKNNA